MINYLVKFFKVLSKNDTGETHSHQSGISIPKDIARSIVFPDLNGNVLNPREKICFFDESDKMWEFQFIYYNDVFFRKDKKRGHNEYRLTCVKDYVRENKILSGDSIWFGLDQNKVRRIGFIKDEEIKQTQETVLVLKGGWKIIKY